MELKMIEEVSFYFISFLVVAWFKDSYKSQIMIQYNH